MLFQDAGNRSSRQSMHFCQLTDREAPLAITNHGAPVHDEFRPANMLSFQLGAAHAAAYAFDNKVAFEFGDGAEDGDLWPGPMGRRYRPFHDTKRTRR